MKKDLTEIICILDESGSMDLTRKDVIGGFNNFIEEQKKIKGEALITLVFFDDRYRVIHSGKNIKDIEKLTTEIYKPTGSTALFDAIGKTINDVGSRLSNTKESEKPEKVIVLIMTDGDENSSKEFNIAKIKEMTEHQQQKYNWEFVYIGANQDSFSTGASLGIKTTANYMSTSRGTADAYNMVSQSISLYRTSGKIDLNGSNNVQTESDEK